MDDLDLKVERLVVINKADAAHETVLTGLKERYGAPCVSALSGEGLDDLKALLARRLEGPDHVPLPSDPVAAYGAASHD